MLDIFEELDKINESLDLYKGVFWIRDPDNPDESKDLIFQIPCNSEGVAEIIDLSGIAKSGNTYNHEKLWNTLPKELTDNKEFNYYPRGRVEVKNGIVDIFVNRNLYTEEIKRFLIAEYNLIEANGIKKIRFHLDNSEHYKSHFD